MKETIRLLVVAALMLMALARPGWAYSENDTDTWLGLHAADALPAGEHWDTFLGSYAGYSNTTGYDNSFLGSSAGYYNTTGFRNSFLGAGAGAANTIGYRNSFIGAFAGHSNTIGWENSFIGAYAGNANTTGDNNSFIGESAGHDNTTGSSNCFVGASAGFKNTEGEYNSFLGAGAGYSNTTGSDNSFIGRAAGLVNTGGSANSFFGSFAGNSNKTGTGNSFLGGSAGYSNNGRYNSFLGYAAGFENEEGSNNVFLGYGAGLSETGSNKLYVDNCRSGLPCDTPFIYGEFDNRILKLDGSLGVGTRPGYGVDVSGTGLSESQLHFSLNGTDTGGWITSVADNNFWLSSGAAWDSAGGGWVQKSADQLAVMAGSGPAGYRVLTRSGCPVGTACPPTSRMTIDYSGQVGFGITPSYPLHMASGARVTVGGVWTDASSRDYKEDIRELSAVTAMSTLQGLNPVTFKYRATEDERHVGFIAEDVPELVATSDRKGMSPMDVVAVLTKVVKEQQEALQEQNKVVTSQQEAIQGQQQANQELMKKLLALEAQQEANQELVQRLASLDAEVKQLRESGADGRLARLAN
jgi:hypothetical protein